ncbi:hypothetical protein CISIN_1g042076mg [Citrus sinensis]|uniref:Uncharacterized protein n=1 Tax=Citrus sinensis TaxID=2711 RepID=A0A067DMP5_CITSI|nr:hypothetical protein CISIN_1g042076mg [Citrus sinensis]
MLKKNVRGKSRGLGCECILHLSKSNLNVDFEIEDGRPTDTYSSRLSTEIVIVVTTFAPLKVDQWRQEKMLELKERSLAEGSKSRFEAEICEEVLSRSSGYVKGLGFVPLPKTHASFKQTTTKLQLKL